MGTGGDFAGAGMGGGMETVKDPAENRYVNVALEPITGSALRTALTSAQPSDAALAVAKRVPVMLSLNMDQRAIPELVATCGSSRLMVEVHQVRMLPKSESAGGMMGMGGEEGMEDMGMGMGGGMMGAGMMGGGGAGPSTEPEDEFPLDMTVEVYGIIYIYNADDQEKLGIELVNEDTVIDGSMGNTASQTAAAAPATGTPAPATGTPAPATGTPAPAAGTPAPAAGTPAPATGGAPAPATGGAPAPASS